MIYSQIQHNLWFGSAPRLDEHFKSLQSLKITAVLSLQDETDIAYGGNEKEKTAAVCVGFAFQTVPIKEFNPTDLQRQLPESVEALERLLRKGHTVYVHCNLGITRSPTVVAAYLCFCSKWNLDRAIAHIKECCLSVSVEPDNIILSHWYRTMSATADLRQKWPKFPPDPEPIEGRMCCICGGKLVLVILNYFRDGVTDVITPADEAEKCLSCGRFLVI